MKKWPPIHVLAVFLSFLCATGAQGQTTSCLDAPSVLAVGVTLPSVGGAGAVESLTNCNDNGIDDAEDIANLTSPDCNTNAIPDECEIDENSQAPGGPFFCTFDCDPDCNRTGVPDECELNDNDCNFDGVPDECGVLIDCGLAHESHKLTASDAAAGDFFGGSVSISGYTAIVGAEHDNDVGEWSGSAYIIQRDYGGPDNWGEVVKLTASDGALWDEFGCSVSVSGDTAVVGAVFDRNLHGAWTGTAYIFQRDYGGANNWGEVVKLNASDGADRHAFGDSTCISGDTAIVGASGSFNGNRPGSAYIFQRDHGGPDNWGEVTILVSSDAANGDIFGFSVSVSGDTAIVGALGDEDAGTLTGSAYIFHRDHGGPDNWGEVVKLTAADAASSDRFGAFVSISGDTAIVGAPRNDDAGSASGSAYIFDRDHGGPGNWGEVTQLAASDAARYDFFGFSVSISGDTAVIGARGHDGTGDSSGAAYIFQRDYGGSDNWGQFAEFTASDAEPGDWLGTSVSISDDTVIVGAHFDDDAGEKSGSAYVFNLFGEDCDCNAIPDECDIAGGADDCQPNGTLDVCELSSNDCNDNGIPDDCEASSPDCYFAPLLLPSNTVHHARKHRFLSIDATTNLPAEVSIKVEIAEMNRCQNDLRRSCIDDEDCPTVCAAKPDLHSCGDGSICPDGVCIPGGPCGPHPDVGLSWYVQEPQTRGVGCPNGMCDEED